MTTRQTTYHGRMFIALPLTDEATKSVAEVLRKLKKKHWPVRWEDVDKWHVTIAFLGEVLDVHKVREVLEVKHQLAPFCLTFRGLERFPEPGKRREGARMHGRMQRKVYLSAGVDTPTPRIIWMGLKGEVQKLELLAKSVRRRLESTGIAYDKKPFKPHVTLGRVDYEIPRGQALEMAKDIDKLWEMSIGGKWKVDRLVLYESTITPRGSNYRIVEQFKLE